MDHSAAVDAAASFVKRQLQELPRDGSHDWWHIHRVHATARSLAREEGIEGASLLAVELAALLHDVEDWKYAPGSAASQFSVKAFLETQDISVETRNLVLDVISRVGFKEELGQPKQRSTPLELAVVQDADRLDAIGAIGIARCFTFGGKFNRVLHDPGQPPRTELSKESYKAVQQTTLNHFYEKLLRLKDLMKTEAGRRRAEARHAFLETFLDEFHREWDAQA